MSIDSQEPKAGFSVRRGSIFDSVPADDGYLMRVGSYAKRFIGQASRGIDNLTDEQRRQAEAVKRFLDSPLRVQQRIHPVDGQPMPHFSLIDHENRESVLEIVGSYSVPEVTENMVMNDLAATREVMGFISGEDQ